MGTLPVWASMDQSETTLKPRTFARGVGGRVFEAKEAELDIAAEPVPVRRPSFLTVVFEVSESSWTGSAIGRTKTGSNLHLTVRKSVGYARRLRGT